VHFNQFFLANFINLENELALAVVHTVGLAMLTNILAGIFTNPFTGLLTFILEVVLGIMTILLLLQMIVRLALVAVCVATAPLGLGCLMLPQSLRWGRLWLTLFASSVMVQFIQIAALGLGGVFITAIASTSFVRLDVQLATAFLAIGTLLLVLKIPGILQNWALHPMMDGFNGGGSGQSGQDATSGGGGGDMSGGGDAMGGMGGGSMGGGMGGAQMMEGTVVTEESGALLLLF
ncbi:MAG: conjugal transfer protein TrbL family protein, partial [Ktedonobacteraceae bacterium]